MGWVEAFWVSEGGEVSPTSVEREILVLMLRLGFITE